MVNICKNKIDFKNLQLHAYLFPPSLELLRLFESHSDMY